eukprot:SAG11_NODE_1206_length_5528_cov_20.313502_7_plen_332_part_00
MTKLLQGAMKLSTMTISTEKSSDSKCDPTLSGMPSCSSESFGHVLMLDIGQNQATLTCSMGDSVGSHIWSTAYVALTVYPYQQVCMHASTLVIWAHEVIVVEPNASLSLRGMMLTKPITVGAGSTLAADSLQFIDVIGPALDIQGAATVSNCTFKGCTADAGSAIYVGGPADPVTKRRSTWAKSMCCSGSLCELCHSSAILTVTKSQFISNAATGKGGAIFLDFPVDVRAQATCPGFPGLNPQNGDGWSCGPPPSPPSGQHCAAEPCIQPFARLSVSGDSVFTGNRGQGCKQTAPGPPPPPGHPAPPPNPDPNCDAIWWCGAFISSSCDLK